MSTYEFTLKLSTRAPRVATEGDFRGVVSFLGGRCDDCTPSLRGGVLRLRFAREAPSRQEAVMSALHDVGRAGFLAEVEPDEGAAP